MWHFTLMLSTEEAVRLSQPLVVSFTLVSSLLSQNSSNLFSWSRFSVQKTLLEESTESLTKEEVTSLKSSNNQELLSSRPRPTCLSTNHSDSLLPSVPTPVVKPSLSASSIIGKSFRETTKIPPASPCRLSWEPERGRVSRTRYPHWTNSTTNCREDALIYLVNYILDFLAIF